MGYGLDIGIKQDSHAPAAKESRNFIGEQRVEVIGKTGKVGFRLVRVEERPLGHSIDGAV